MCFGITVELSAFSLHYAPRERCLQDIIIQTNEIRFAEDKIEVPGGSVSSQLAVQSMAKTYFNVSAIQNDSCESTFGGSGTMTLETAANDRSVSHALVIAANIVQAIS
jgi:hypothetical protein